MLVGRLIEFVGLSRSRLGSLLLSALVVVDRIAFRNLLDDLRG
jgi:hypothetical protein